MKSVGYLISIVSVLLLAIPASKAASEDGILFLCLIGGVSASVVGMLLRWVSHAREKARRG